MKTQIEEHIDSVFRFALSLTKNRHAAEDLSQECLLRAQQKIHQLKEPSKTKSWLFQIVVNLWKDHLRKKQPNLVETDIATLFAESSRPDETLIQKEEKIEALQMMQALPDKQRNVLFLSVVEQLSNQEIGELLGMNVNSVKASLSIARKTMRYKLITSKENEPTRQ